VYEDPNASPDIKYVYVPGIPPESPGMVHITGGDSTGGGEIEYIYLTSAPPGGVVPPPSSGSGDGSTGTGSDGVTGGEVEVTDDQEDQAEDDLENGGNLPPIYAPTPDATPTGSEGGKKFKLKYTGGDCIVNMRFVSAGMLPGSGACACFKGKTYVLLGGKALRAVTEGKQQAVFSRWKCKGVQGFVCPPGACSL
jgi:hypothetical protein